ncbi:hypothetical protein DSO57_1016708 [Entomophthora muscae]|uniref:Uncharacterized protein n=1 Tax=Entomophthora muscae TaxID=34485 RepID=A0ACC2S7A8_9FUNG|nr:hypothetical protein DSO57_1016708 [Entomophthora muscae]
MGFVSRAISGQVSHQVRVQLAAVKPSFRRDDAVCSQNFDAASILQAAKCTQIKGNITFDSLGKDTFPLLREVKGWLIITGLSKAIFEVKPARPERHIWDPSGSAFVVSQAFPSLVAVDNLLIKNVKQTEGLYTSLEVKKELVVEDNALSYIEKLELGDNLQLRVINNRNLKTLVIQPSEQGETDFYFKDNDLLEFHDRSPYPAKNFVAINSINEYSNLGISRAVNIVIESESCQMLKLDHLVEVTGDLTIKVNDASSYLP